MTTNQTIDGVPRSVCHACATYSRDACCPVCDPAAQPRPDPVLCKFYDAEDWTGLVRELVCHVAQLQESAKRNVKPWEDTFPPTLLPAYVERVNAENAAAQPQGEPVAWMYRREGGECLGQLVQMEGDDLKDVREGKVVEGRRILWPRDDYTDWRPLYAEQPAPVTLDFELAAQKLASCMDYPWDHMPEQGRDAMRGHAKAIINAAVPVSAERPTSVAVALPDRDRLRDIIAQAIGSDTYDCIRVWEAWGVGTMSSDDFVLVVDQEARLYEIADACIVEVARVQGIKP